jgi:hypothetical protein
MDKVEKVQGSDLNVIPSEFIEPYLAKFMGNMVSYFSSAYLTEEEREKNGGYHWTVDEVKGWIKGVEKFVSQTCGIHARYAMMNEMDKMVKVPNEKLKEICRKVEISQFKEEENEN